MFNPQTDISRFSLKLFAMRYSNNLKDKIYFKRYGYLRNFTNIAKDLSIY